ncbi:uncharacterized protein LOC135392838 [Ornithodoros turicata]|uniref:uncharacterized protein LOC135392838 n=1 Tax=Ornithodoros turicata TaxID=34597 RepID=UPI00313A1CCC
MKNVRSQFLAPNRLFCNNGKFLDPKYLRMLLEIQQKQNGFKLVRGLTRKHLFPNNLEKMNVKRSVDIFKPEVTAVLRYLLNYGHHVGISGFGASLPTIEFLEIIFKWFTLHNIKSTNFHIFSRDPMRMPFYCENDERLSWLEDTFLAYINQWKQAAPANTAFLSPETYEALHVTTNATVLCTRYLLSHGFKYVLTFKYSSDEVESLFSAIRQLIGSNDQADAYAALSALHKIVVTGLIKPSASANVQNSDFQLSDLLKAPSSPVPQVPRANAEATLLPYLGQLKTTPAAPCPGIKAATVALIGGYLVKVIEEKINCAGCLERFKCEAQSGPTVAVINNLDRGSLSYPSPQFVSFLVTLESAASSIRHLLLETPKPLSWFVSKVSPAVHENALFTCATDVSDAHKTMLVQTVLEKFVRPFLTNISAHITQESQKKKVLHNKPLSRKVLKL